ncbi:hypothetical protein HFO16_32930 [Rhizobium laguerreae]|nr:hypothetical protein [Rhizobium laguerreae]MBY3251183.1 hypothetical protein [Rhizobium laguerreae]
MIASGSCSVVEQFGDRLITTHINDNFGATDDHLLPFDGRIGWEAATRAIAATKYEPPLNMETERTFYQRAHKVAVRLEEQILAYRGMPRNDRKLGKAAASCDAVLRRTAS